MTNDLDKPGESVTDGEAIEWLESTLSPITPRERIAALDVLRGCALLGIIVVNIQSFASLGYNPSMAANIPSLDRFAWFFTYVFFRGKMLMIFSLLFGAGMVLMDRRARKLGQSAASIYYRRLLWLAVFGVLHAYLLWAGDILFGYALAGIFLYPLCRLPPKVLIPLGFVGYALLPILSCGAGYALEWMQATTQTAIAAGEKATEVQLLVQQAWSLIETRLRPSSDAVALQLEIFRGGYWPLFLHRATNAMSAQVGAIVVIKWGFLGIMLWGVCLMEWGVLTGVRSRRFYVNLMVGGYLIGLPIVMFGAYDIISHDFDLIRALKFSYRFNDVGCIAVALGHIGLIMAIYKSGWFPRIIHSLAAAGRLALTNYLLQSVICATIFYGWGFGRFGHLSRPSLFGVVVAIWVLQLVISPLWLRSFRYGPAEWLWRSLSYGKRQPMRLISTAADPP